AHAQVKVREGARLALRETLEEPLVRALAAFAQDRSRPADARAVALELLAAVHRRRPVWKGEWWAYHPALTPPPAKTETWPGTPLILAALRSHLNDGDPRARRASVEGLKVAGDTATAAALRARFRIETDLGVSRALIAALGSFRDTGSRGLI